ncbi:MAG: hypothetical protein JWO02_738 [Solirubrobacterales bacterium]|nr:hypothetical protein [Solirubrobacterales bacterium]
MRLRQRTPAVVTALVALGILVPVLAVPARGQILPVYRPNAFTISSNGEKPSIAVDEEGTAHVVWNEANNGPVADVMHYCKVPRGARRCTAEQTFVPPDGDPQYNHEFARPQVVLPGPDQVMIFTSRYPNSITLDGTGRPNPVCGEFDPPPALECYTTSTKTWMYRSIDNGASFTPPRVFDHNPPGGDMTVFQFPVPVPGDPGITRAVPFVGSVTETTTGGTFFATGPLDGYARKTLNLGNEGNDRAFFGTIAPLNDTTPAVAFADLQSNVFIRTHPDPSRSLADIGAWTPSVSIKGDEPRLAGGPSGLFLLYKPRLGDRSAPYTLRRFDGRAFVGPAVRISDVPADAWRDVFQDDSGRLHTAWVSRQDTSSAIDELRYRFSTDAQNFTQSETIARGARNSIYNVTLGSADDGGGFAVYSTTFSGKGAILLAPFGTTAKRTLIDVSVAGMDITQGIQRRTFATRSPDPARPASFAYDGVNLAGLHATVVRVYANSRRPLAGGAVPPMTLVGFKDGRQLGGGALLPDARPTALPVAAPHVIADADKVSTTSVYTFTLPWQWAQGNVVLRAEINPPGLLPPVAECRLCRNDNAFTVTNIPFKATTRVRFVPAAITVNGAGPNGFPDPSPLFAGARATSPLPFDLPDYQGTLDMSDLANATTVTVKSCFLGIFPCSSSQRAITQSERLGFALSRLGDWATNDSSSVYPIGVFHDGSTLGGVTNGGAQLYGGTQPLSLVRDSRPLTSLAHEVGHGLGRPHAGLTCGSNANGQVGEAWPPSDDGALDGIGLDTTKAPPYAVLDAAAAGAPATYFDLMSYCANTNEKTAGGNVPNAWMSLRNWERALVLNAPKLRAAAPRTTSTARVAVAAQAKPNTLRVQALVPVDGAPSILNVAPDAGGPTPIDPAARYRLIARDAAGKELATAGAVGQLQHVEAAPPIVIVTGRVPAAGAAAVDVVQDGTVVTQQVASKNAPVVRVLSPRQGTTVGQGGRAQIRWRATDADAGDKLTAIVEYSSDNGRTFRTVSIGASKGTLRLPAAMLTASRQARVRVRVQDGFRETVATSGRFVSLGAPPRARIVTPGPGVTTRVEAGSGVTLRGEAFDDAGRALSGPALTWRVGKRTIARGDLVVAAGLPPGRQRIVLQAKDRAGRTSIATVLVQMTPRPPLFLALKGPSRLRANARTLTLTVVASYASRLSIGTTKLTVGRTPRKVTVAVKPGSSLLQLTAALSSGRLVSRQTVQIPRG